VTAIVICLLARELATNAVPQEWRAGYRRTLDELRGLLLYRLDSHENEYLLRRNMWDVIVRRQRTTSCILQTPPSFVHKWRSL
jgi:hypothetical protein